MGETIKQTKTPRRNRRSMFGDHKASPEEVAAFKKRVAEKQANDPQIAKLVVENDSESEAQSPSTGPVSNDDKPIVFDTVKLSPVQKRILDRLSDKEKQSIAKAKRMSETGARAWMAETHKTDLPKPVAIATVFAGMERAKVDEGPFVNFINAVSYKWPEFNP